MQTEQFGLFNLLHAARPERAITSQSHVRIRPPPLEPPVSKSRYHRVFRKAGIYGCRPFCVLSPDMATTSSITRSLKVSGCAQRATRALPSGVAAGDRFGPKLSAVSVSRPGWVIGSCERSIGRNHAHVTAGGPRGRAALIRLLVRCGVCPRFHRHWRPRPPRAVRSNTDFAGRNCRRWFSPQRRSPQMIPPRLMQPP